jgi:hypothetical protein
MARAAAVLLLLGALCTGECAEPRVAFGRSSVRFSSSVPSKCTLRACLVLALGVTPRTTQQKPVVGEQHAAMWQMFEWFQLLYDYEMSQCWAQQEGPC